MKPVSIVLLHILLISMSWAQQFNGVDYLIEEAIGERIFPGATIIIGTETDILYHNAYGHFTYNTSSTEVDTNHIFDLASCTKVFATTSCIMRLVDSGLVDIEEKVSTYLPDFAQNGKEDVRVRNLLLHNSGLRAYYTPSGSQTPEQIINAIFALSLTYPIGTYEYSCLNFVTLMKVVEAVTDKPMYQFYTEEFTAPLEMQRTMFSPPDSLHSQCLPTSSVKGYQGIVHDPLARGLDGYSGNAGLFSTTADLAKLCQILLNQGIYSGTPYFEASTVEQFTTRYNPGGTTRALGWGTNASGGTSAGSLFSPESFGHTGYTGTSVWCDPVRKIFVIFLTNRVYPDDTASVTSTRQHVHDAVIRAIEGIPPQPNLDFIRTESADTISMSWQPSEIMEPVTETEVWMDTGSGFEHYASFTADTTVLKIPMLITAEEPTIKVKLRNTYQDKQSDWSDTYVLRGSEKELLIVDGYDRIGSWGKPYHHFASVHADALPDTLHIASCDNDCLLNGSINLTDYRYVLWILADESTSDETFSSDEQELLATYLEKGGSLFVSGSEIGWDLGRSTQPFRDRQFYKNYLKAEYAGDDAGNYSINGVSATLFEGLAFSYGTGSALYIEDYPDYLRTAGNSSACLKYGNGRNAAVCFSGTFGSSNTTGNLVYLGFPFETIVGSEKRTEVLHRVIDYFQQNPTTIPERSAPHIAETMILYQNYPNPFNPVTTIRYRIAGRIDGETPYRASQRVELTIHNILGETIATLVSGKQPPGIYSVQWNAAGMASGIYFYTLTTDQVYSITKKLVVLR